jgi:hypothetical protein
VLPFQAHHAIRVADIGARWANHRKCSGAAADAATGIGGSTMRVIVKTQSSVWEVVEVVEQEGMPADALNRLVYVTQAIDAEQPLKCRLTAATDGAERWVAFYREGLEYVSAEECRFLRPACRPRRRSASSGPPMPTNKCAPARARCLGRLVA